MIRFPIILTFTRGWERNIFCFFQTAETGSRTPISGVKGSGTNHYPRAPALDKYVSFFTQKTGVLVSWLKLPARKVSGSSPALVFKFQRNKMFLPCSLMKIKYCGEPPWPRGSVLDLRPPGLEFRILCLEGSVIWFISPFSGSYSCPI